jgi:hypothetical protein
VEASQVQGIDFILLRHLGTIVESSRVLVRLADMDSAPTKPAPMSSVSNRRSSSRDRRPIKTGDAKLLLSIAYNTKKNAQIGENIQQTHR